MTGHRGSDRVTKEIGSPYLTKLNIIYTWAAVRVLITFLLVETQLDFVTKKLKQESTAYLREEATL
mgnify:CR=1 FL=1